MNKLTRKLIRLYLAGDIQVAILLKLGALPIIIEGSNNKINKFMPELMLMNVP